MIGGISRLLILEIGKPPSYCRYSGLKELEGKACYLCHVPVLYIRTHL